MTAKFDQERLLELADAHCQDALDDARFAELETMLRDDPDACAAFGNYIQLHANLEERLQAEEVRYDGLPGPSKRIASVASFFTRPTPFSLTVAALVMLLLVTTMAIMVPPFYRTMTQGGGNGFVVEASPDVARVSGLYEVTWTTGATRWQLGTRLQPTRSLSIQSGIVELTFNSGATALLEGPCEFVIDTNNGGVLSSGKLTARVPPEAVGFTVQTPSAVIVDLGTEFGLVVTDQGTDIAVFQGQVQATGVNNSNTKTISIGQGQAFRLLPKSDRPQPIELAAAAFATVLPQEQRKVDPYVAAVLADRPVGYWRLNDFRTTAALDYAGRGHGLYYGNPTQDAAARPGEDDGRSVRFDGVDDYVEMKHRLALNTDDFTLEAWVQLNHQPRDFASIITSRDDAPRSAGYMLYVSPTGQWECWTGNGSLWSMLKGPPAEVGKWTHVAVTYQRMRTGDDGLLTGIACIFVDGKLIAKQNEFTYRPLREYSRPLRIGAGASEQDPPKYFFTGQIADVAVYDRALSAAQVQTHFDVSHPPSELIDAP